MAKSKASSAAAATLSSKKSKALKTRTKVHFYRPKTLKLARNPKYQRQAVTTLPKMDAYRVIKAPSNSETSMSNIEDNNTLVFIVDMLSNKRQIKAAVQKLYSLDASKVAKVNTLITPKGTKKAYVKLTPDVDAIEVANKIGLL